MIVGTAGHVDHGKTTLVRALTGVDTDRLQEEKRRGISIDLGFAYMPGADGQTIGFVDVPGHESLVRTMVAGVCGIDLALLVVAADEGVKPQTREHVEILRLLGLDRGIVVVTKSDRADEQQRAAVRAELAVELATSPFRHETPLFVSAASDEGMDTLRRRLADETRTSRRAGADKVFRLAVDRSFTLKGVGTIVTGTIIGGRVALDDIVTVMPGGKRTRVRSIHVQNQPASEGAAGDRCALALVGIDRDLAGRGAWICGETAPFETTRSDVELHVSSSEARALKQQTPVHFHCGASDIPARVLLLACDALPPGGTAFAQAALAHPLPLRHGDRFVLRDTSGRRTIGGGKIVDLRPPTRRRGSPQRLARLAAMREDKADVALRNLLEEPAAFEPLAAFAADRGLTTESTYRLVDQLGLCVLATSETHLITTPIALAAGEQRILDHLAEMHAAQPDLPGPAAGRVQAILSSTMPKTFIAALAAKLVDDRRIIQDGPWLRLPTHVVQMSEQDQRIADLMLPLIEKNRFRPPRVRDVGEQLAFHETRVRHACKALVRSGTLIEIAHDHFFTRDTVVDMANVARDLTDHAGWFTAADFRDRLDNGRKVAIQILEYFDRRGITLRAGDLRRALKAPTHSGGVPEDFLSGF